MIDIQDNERIRTIRLTRPEAKNAVNEAMWDVVTEALIEAADNRDVAVVVFTGSEDSFSAGADLQEMALGNAGKLERGTHGFNGFTKVLVEFPKPFICAVNGLGIGFGLTVLGLSDLVFMSTNARMRCPFTSLGVAPELGSSFTLPRLLGRQNATWVLLSSEWITAEQCAEMGLVFRLCEPEELMDLTMDHARVLASKPISSLVESKALIVEPYREEIAAARSRENGAFARLLGAPANVEALAAFAERREPNFADVD